MALRKKYATGIEAFSFEDAKKKVKNLSFMFDAKIEKDNGLEFIYSRNGACFIFGFLECEPLKII
ncbi:MAG: hypothetical protein AABY22_04875 [Nanoarchaeota archaeon]